MKIRKERKSVESDGMKMRTSPHIAHRLWNVWIQGTHKMGKIYSSGKHVSKTV